MSIKLNSADHKELDNFLGKILEWHAKEEITKPEAIGAIAHVLAAAAIDNETEIKSWLHDPTVLADWKKQSSLLR